MRHIHIDYSPDEMEASRKRMAAFTNFEPVDRVPVNFCIVPRYFTRIFGIEYNEIFKDADTQFEWLLKFAKYEIENIRSDRLTAPVITISPYFDNVIPSSAFGAEIRWPYDETPHAIPTIRTLGQMERFEIPDLDAGLWGVTKRWWARMGELAKETRVTFAGGVEGRVEVGWLGLTGLGPHMIAIDLIGETFYAWMLEEPEACARFLDKITSGMILADQHARKIDPRISGGTGLADDTCTVMSPHLYREAVVPHDLRYFHAFPGVRAMHMCGDSRHLLGVLRDDLGITDFNVFGYQVPPEIAARELGGRMRLWGNVNPMRMLNGTKADVLEAANRALQYMAPCRGFMLGDGANVCPHTPLENINALMEASIAYGAPESHEK